MNRQQDQNTLLSTEALAAELNLAVETLAEWRRQHRGPAYIKAGRRVLYRRDDIDTWLANNRHSFDAAVQP